MPPEIVRQVGKEPAQVFTSLLSAQGNDSYFARLLNSQSLRRNREEKKSFAIDQTVKDRGSKKPHPPQSKEQSNGRSSIMDSPEVGMKVHSILV